MKPVMDKITTVTDKICYYVSYLSMAVIVIMMVLMTVDVVASHVFNYRIAGCFEINQMILSTLVFSSWAYTQTVHGHMHVTMFINKMHQIPRFICFGLTSLISVVTMAFGTWAVWSQIFSVMDSGECTATLLIPYWPFYIFEFLAFLLLAIVLFRDAVKAIIAIGNKEMAQEIEATWV